MTNSDHRHSPVAGIPADAFHGCAWEGTNSDRCVLCGAAVLGASPQAKRIPALTDAQLMDVLRAVTAGERDAAVWFDDQLLCVLCARDAKASHFDAIVERRRAQQDAQGNNDVDE